MDFDTDEDMLEGGTLNLSGAHAGRCDPLRVEGARGTSSNFPATRVIGFVVALIGALIRALVSGI
jgi:hypothetical protein